MCESERRLVGSATSVFEVDLGLGEREGKPGVEVGSGIGGPVPRLDLGPGPTTVEGPEELVGGGSDRRHPARPSGVRVTDLPGPEVCCHDVERGRPGSRQLQAPATDRSLDPERHLDNIELVPFTAQTRMSGLDWRPGQAGGYAVPSFRI